MGQKNCVLACSLNFFQLSVRSSDVDLLEALRKMPTIAPLRTLAWPTRGLACRLGKLYVSLFASFFQCLDRDAPLVDTEVAIRLILALSVLILAMPLKLAKPEEQQNNKESIHKHATQ